jgi:hypothetical protein
MGVRSPRRVYRDPPDRVWLNNFEKRELTRTNSQSFPAIEDINPLDHVFIAFDYLYMV